MPDDEIKIAFPSQFVGPSLHEGLIWVSNASCDDDWANAAIVEGRLQAGPARATLSYPSAVLEAQGIVGLYGPPIPKPSTGTITVPMHQSEPAAERAMVAEPETDAPVPAAAAEPSTNVTKKKGKGKPAALDPQPSKPPKPAKADKGTRPMQETLF